MNHIIIIDNSHSMVQKTFNRLSFLEIAKNFAETYILTRTKMPETKGDKYFIFSAERDAKKDLQSFASVQDIGCILESLRAISPAYNCDLFHAVKTSVDFLNAFRMVTGADNYHGGRDVLKSENSNVILSYPDIRGIGLPGLGVPALHEYAVPGQERRAW